MLNCDGTGMETFRANSILLCLFEKGEVGYVFHLVFFREDRRACYFDTHNLAGLQTNSRDLCIRLMEVSDWEDVSFNMTARRSAPRTVFFKELLGPRKLPWAPSSHFFQPVNNYHARSAPHQAFTISTAVSRDNSDTNRRVAWTFRRALRTSSPISCRDSSSSV